MADAASRTERVGEGSGFCRGRQSGGRHVGGGMTRSARTLACSALVFVALAGCAGGAKRRGSKYDLGLYLQKQGKSEEAISAYQQSLQADADDPTPRQALAAAYFAKGWRAQALQEW